jgi:hypothetical protein
VFSGERVIAKKIWDPESPHWNFCQPLPLRQLSEDAGRALLSQPLESLQITISRRAEFLDEALSVSSGHPQILQFVGDRLVRLLNEKPTNDRTVLMVDDLHAITAAYAFREHYLETYWGQATELERALSAILASGETRMSRIADRLKAVGIDLNRGELIEAMRMIELYGIADAVSDGYSLRAEWFPVALELYGGASEAIARLAGRG